MAAINSQFKNGYVIEYITKKFDLPNPGFEANPDYISAKDTHTENAGRLIAIHKLMVTAKPLPEIIGQESFEKLQDMWAAGANRRRWSVAFPIIETYEIEGRPLVTDVFDRKAVQRLFGYTTSNLRPLNDRERDAIANLTIIKQQAKNEWIKLDQEFLMAEMSQIDPSLESDINADLFWALEGETDEKKSKFRRRSAWLAQQFIKRRRETNTLICDSCNFDPKEKIGSHSIDPRSLLDAHHIDPLAEGKRKTGIEDFSLLCPTCHRFTHALINKG